MAENSPLRADDGELTEYEYEQLSRSLPDGLIGHPDDAPPVTVAGGTVSVRAGLSGNLRGFPWSTDTATPYTPNLAGAARTDLVVLRLDRPAGHVVGSAYKVGVPGAGSPAFSTDTTPGGVYEIPLTDVNISGGVITSLKRRCWYVGPDGQYLCDSTDTLPPHYPGRMVTRTDLKRTYVSTGAAPWLLVAEDSGQLPITLVSGWAFTSSYLCRVGGVGIAQFSIQRTGGALGVARLKVATLHASCRPSVRFETVVYVTGASDGTGKYPTFAEFRTDGEVWLDLNRGIAKNAYAIVANSTFNPA